MAQRTLPFSGRSVEQTHRSFACGRWVIILVALLVCLVACGGSGIRQTAQTQHYTVQLNLDSTGFGERTATIEVHNTDGQPVVADQVVLSPVMEQMGMAAPEATADMIAPGRYQAKGEFFSMIGEWQVDVRVTVRAMEEVARFNVQAIQE